MKAYCFFADIVVCVTVMAFLCFFMLIIGYIVKIYTLIGIEARMTRMGSFYEVFEATMHCFLFTAAPGRMRNLGWLALHLTRNNRGGCAQMRQIANINKFNPTSFVYFLGTGDYLTNPASWMHGWGNE